MITRRFKKYKNFLFDYWQAMSRGMYRRMSRGAFQINRMITFARRDNWRRPGGGNREKKKSQ
jgi:hypothetical protein